MDNTTEFFENEVKGRFERWKPAGALVKDWLEWLVNVDYDIALKSIKQCKFETKLPYPSLKKFYALAKKFKEKRYPAQNSPTPSDYIPATPEQKIAILRNQAANGSEFAQMLLEKKQIDPVPALADKLSEGNYRERNEG